MKDFVGWCNSDEVRYSKKDFVATIYLAKNRIIRKKQSIIHTVSFGVDSYN